MSKMGFVGYFEPGLKKATTPDLLGRNLDIASYRYLKIADTGPKQRALDPTGQNLWYELVFIYRADYAHKNDKDTVNM